SYPNGQMLRPYVHCLQIKTLYDSCETDNEILQIQSAIGNRQSTVGSRQSANCRLMTGDWRPEIGYWRLVPEGSRYFPAK
ncbi:MAG: hypothetical protein CV080_08275, partial [Candidatus Kuenenia stuttgartiensis]